MNFEYLKPLDCYYSKEIIAEAARFEFLTVGAGCIDCPLINSKTCGYLITQANRNEIQADPDTWALIAHCDLRFKEAVCSVD